MTFGSLSQFFDEMINSKIDFIRKFKNGSVSQFLDKDRVTPMAALERFGEVQRKLDSQSMDDLLTSNSREIVWRPRAQASAGHDLAVRKRSP